MAPLQFSAGCRVGECHPSGLLLTDVFSTEDRAAGLYAVDLYRSRELVCMLIDPDQCDEGCHGDIDEEDLTNDEYARYLALSDVKWSPANVSGVWMAEHAGEDLIVYSLDGAWSGSLDGGSGTITAADRVQVMARLTCAAIDMQAAA